MAWGAERYEASSWEIKNKGTDLCRVRDVIERLEAECGPKAVGEARGHVSGEGRVRRVFFLRFA